jgi:nucleotide-binding universal stress UspA family protein
MKSITMKKVLIALDYDPTAQKVADTGYALAKEMKAETVLLHVISSADYYTSNISLPIMGYNDFGNPELTKVYTADELKKEMQTFLDKSKEHLGNKAIQTVVAEGEFADTILRIATAIHADVIVMGSHSRRWLEKILMGSVTETVLHKTSIPLFIVPTKG